MQPGAQAEMFNMKSLQNFLIQNFNIQFPELS